MKTRYVILTTTVIILFITACKKEAGGTLSQLINKNGTSESGQTSLIAKWKIVTDSTFEGVGSNNHPVNYQGQAGDYFDIRENGYIYTREGTVLDTLSYTLISNSTIGIRAFGLEINNVPATSQIKNFSAHAVTIVSPLFLTPGGEFGRRVSLSR